MPTVLNMRSSLPPETRLLPVLMLNLAVSGTRADAVLSWRLLVGPTLRLRPCVPLIPDTGGCVSPTGDDLRDVQASGTVHDVPGADAPVGNIVPT